MRFWFTVILTLGAVSLQAQPYFVDSTFKQQITQLLAPITATSKDYEQQLQTFLTFWDSELSADHQLLLNAFNTFYQNKLDQISYIRAISAINLLVSYSQHQFLLKLLGALAEFSGQNSAQFNWYINYVRHVLNDSLISYGQKLNLKIVNGDFSLDLDSDKNIEIRSNGKVDLVIAYSGDSTIITSTSGFYTTKDNAWHGNGGKIFWTKLVGDSTVVAYLKSYIIPANEPQFTIEQVRLDMQMEKFHAKGLMGELYFNFSANPKLQQRNPSFYAKDTLTVKNLAPQMDFRGLIRLKGKFLNIAGLLEFKLRGRKIIKVWSDQFDIRQNFIRSLKARVVVQLGDRQLLHPQLNMLLLFDTALIYQMYPYLLNRVLSLDPPRLLSFYREDKGPANQPFWDYYHNMKIYTSEMLWAFGNKLYFVQSPKTSVEKPYLESMNFYADGMLTEFQDVNGVNYAIAFYQFLRKQGYPSSVWLSDFYAYLLKRGVKTTKRYVATMIERMAQHGLVKMRYHQQEDKFLIYDINPVLYHLVRASTREKLIARKRLKLLDKYSEDFDIIRIYAEPVFDTLNLSKKLNYFMLRNAGIVAVLDLNTYLLRVLRPKPFYLSQARSVKVFADTLDIKRDMDFIFDGSLGAGLTWYKGRDFEFNYKKFKLNLTHVDKMRLWTLSKIDSMLVRYKIKNGDTIPEYEYQYKLDTIVSVLRNFRAELKIDSAGNKSGLLAKRGDGYPILRALTNSKIYYPKASLDTSNFYFLNYPFVLKNLGYLIRDSITMVGLFHSSILDDLDSLKLTIQHDNSLGFQKRDTINGFRILGRARLLGLLRLDNKGLHSLGRLKFLSVVAKGDFELYPGKLAGTVDSMVVNPVNDTLRGQLDLPARYPYIVFDGQAKLSLYSNEDSTQTLEVFDVSQKEKFDLYPNFLKGNERGEFQDAHLYVDYNGAHASGTMDFIDAQLISDSFQLDYDYFYADTCRFIYKDSSFKETLFNTNNVSCYMDLQTRIGTFVSNDVENYISFPKNRYLVYSDHFLWKINKGLIDIGGQMDNPNYIVVNSEAERDSLLQTGKYDAKMIRLSGTRLVSMKKRNPVNFQAARSVYDPRTSIIKAYDVPELKIADSRIIPSTPVIIRVGGVLDTLRSARLYVGKFEHKIYNATVYIADGKNYWAKGVYHYQDTQQIYFNSIKPEIDTISIGVARLRPGEKLYLNKYFIYTGASSHDKIVLRGDRSMLHFSGAVRILSKCDTIKPRLIAIDQEINPDTVMIKVDFPIKARVGIVTAAPIVHKSTSFSYDLINTFLTRPPNFQVDKILTKVKGYLYYNERKAYYIIGDSLKVLHPDTSMPMVAFDYKRCFLFAEDQFDLGINYGQDLQYKVLGFYSADLHENTNMLRNVIIKLDFPYLDRIFMVVQRDLGNMAEPEYVDFESDKDLKRAILLSTDDPKERQEFLLSGKLPKSLNGTLVLANVNLIWDKNRSSFRTPKGKNRLALLYLNGKEQDLVLNGYVEFRYARQRLTRIYVYLDLGDGNYYFFRYLFDGRTGFMNILSSSGKAERLISELERKQRQLTKHFEIGTAEKDELKRFLRLYGESL